MTKHECSFKNFYKLDNNALITLTVPVPNNILVQNKSDEYAVAIEDPKETHNKLETNTQKSDLSNNTDNDNVQKMQEKNEMTDENKGDYTFDGVYFENIEKIGAFPPIINLKNALKLNNGKERYDCVTILKNHHPQLYQFMNKHIQSFEIFFELHNNALLTLNVVFSDADMQEGKKSLVNESMHDKDIDCSAKEESQEKDKSNE